MYCLSLLLLLVCVSFTIIGQPRNSILIRVLVVWYLCSVPNLVQISVIVTEIDAHMLQTFIWSRGHLCMALLRLPIKFGADIFIQSGVIDIFSKIKDGGRRHLGIAWVSHWTTHEPHSWCVPPVKILS